MTMLHSNEQLTKGRNENTGDCCQKPAQNRRLRNELNYLVIYLNLCLYSKNFVYEQDFLS